MDRTAGDLEMSYITITVDGSTSTLNFGTGCEITEKTSNGLTIKLDKSVTNGAYSVTTQKLLDNGNPEGSDTTTTYSQNPVVIDNLDSGYMYDVTVQLIDGQNYGDKIKFESVKLNENSFNGKMVSGNKNPMKIDTAKQYMDITYVGKIENQWAMAYKDFSAVTIAEKYFTFGTSLFLGSITGNSKEAGGIGFFMNEGGTKGYMVLVETVPSAASKDRKSVRILKATADKLIVLADSQKTSSSTFAQLFSASKYDIDVKVKVEANKVWIDAYVNGFLISAVDITNSSGNTIYTPTQKIALGVMKGTILFDYVYASSISQAMYESKDYVTNFYSGQFSNDVIQSGYGDIIYDSMASEDQLNTDFISKNKIAVDEFGPVVREIVHVEQKFNQRPAYPVAYSLGLNKYGRIIGSTRSSFGGEAYVLNNSSVTIPLDDGNNLSFYCFGNSIAPAGELTYSTDETTEYTNKEPITFSTQWLQNLSDVEKLGQWIKTNVVNKGKVVSLNVFGNPMISVGDIVSISYSPQNLTGSEKFIVTAVENSFSQGLDTTLTCRTL